MDTEEADLEKLLADSARGSQAAFRELYEATAPRLLAVARRLLHDHHRAEDALQQAMVSVWNSAASFDPQRARASTWLVSIVRNRSIDMLRREVRQHSALTDDRHDILAVLGQDEPLKVREPLSRTVARKLGRCFGEISNDQAGCIQLAYLDGLTFSEIAAHLERSIGTVKSWVRRGLQQLRECVER